MGEYSYKELSEGVISVYKGGVWMCFINEGGIEEAKRIFEQDVDTHDKPEK